MSSLYSYSFSFEDGRAENRFHNYVEKRWTDSIILAIVYVVCIFLGQRFMRDRPGYDLRTARVLWNGSLAVFSLLGCLRTIPETAETISRFSLEHSICIIDQKQPYTSISKTWSALFVFSKAIELGDTVFIVLRKQRLIFLHWYHHATVLIYVWYSYSNYTAAGRWFIVMNYIAHTFVYLYYTLAALRIRIPVFMKMIITCTQILQMVVGVTINVWTYRIKNRGGACQQTYQNILFSSIMYFSYFLLFSHFFYIAYLKGKDKSQKKVQ